MGTAAGSVDPVLWGVEGGAPAPSSSSLESKSTRRRTRELDEGAPEEEFPSGGTRGRRGWDDLATVILTAPAGIGPAGGWGRSRARPPSGTTPSSSQTGKLSRIALRSLREYSGSTSVGKSESSTSGFSPVTLSGHRPGWGRTLLQRRYLNQQEVGHRVPAHEAGTAKLLDPIQHWLELGDSGARGLPVISSFRRGRGLGECVIRGREAHVYPLAPPLVPPLLLQLDEVVGEAAVEAKVTAPETEFPASRRGMKQWRKSATDGITPTNDSHRDWEMSSTCTALG